jgi:hypothetical protein
MRVSGVTPEGKRITVAASRSKSYAHTASINDDRGEWTAGDVPTYSALMNMPRIPGPLGSQGGEWRQSSNGKQYLVKPLQDQTHGFNEIAAGAVYREAGVKFPNTGMTRDSHGNYYLVSEKYPGLVQRSGSWWSQHPEVQDAAARDFGTDALLSHWDVLGLGADNTLVDKSGSPVRIESGGAMQFRAMGDSKPGFSSDSDWVEPESMRTSPQGRSMYGKMTDAQAADSLDRASAIDLDAVQDRWDALGIPRTTSDPWMATLQARQEKIPGIVNEPSIKRKALQV